MNGLIEKQPTVTLSTGKYEKIEGRQKIIIIRTNTFITLALKSLKEISFSSRFTGYAVVQFFNHEI